MASASVADEAPPASPEAPLASPIVSVTTVEPRGFGYFVGDVFTREIDVAVAKPYRLDAASQPAPGRLNYWLDLRSVKVTETASGGERHYRLAIEYQAFYVPLSTTAVVIPGLNLRFTNGAESVSAEVPKLSVLMSPLREVVIEKPEGGPSGYLKPDAVLPEASTLKARIAIGVGAICALLAFVLLAYHQAWGPFRSRPERPFTRAARAIRAQLARGRGLESYGAGLLNLHRAFDKSAGRRVLAADVPGFLANHPQFQPLGDEIASFFANSRRAFFGNDMVGAETGMPLEELAVLGARLGDAERRSA